MLQTVIPVIANIIMFDIFLKHCPVNFSGSTSGDVDVYVYETSDGKTRVVIVFEPQDGVTYEKKTPNDQDLYTVEVCDFLSNLLCYTQTWFS